MVIDVFNRNYNKSKDYKASLHQLHSKLELCFFSTGKFLCEGIKNKPPDAIFPNADWIPLEILMKNLQKLNI